MSVGLLFGLWYKMKAGGKQCLDKKKKNGHKSTWNSNKRNFSRWGEGAGPEFSAVYYMLVIFLMARIYAKGKEYDQ